ncbi:hypothetical protein [Nonomuraea monospora]
MEALALRLSQLDRLAEGAIRVVMFYDTLMRRRVDLQALARASAVLAECVAGIRLHGTGQVLRMTPGGSRASEPAPDASTAMPVTLDEEEIGTVWLERAEPPNPLDELLLDRLAIAVAAVVERYGPARTTMADPALVELVISAGTDEAARARALHLLGFAPDLPLHVIAVRTSPPPSQSATRTSPPPSQSATRTSVPPDPNTAHLPAPPTQRPPTPPRRPTSAAHTRPCRSTRSGC